MLKIEKFKYAYDGKCIFYLQNTELFFILRVLSFEVNQIQITVELLTGYYMQF